MSKKIRQLLLDLLSEYQEFEKPGNPELLKLHIEATESKLLQVIQDTQKQLIDRIEREVIGSNIIPDCSRSEAENMVNIEVAKIQNTQKAEERTKLKQIREGL